MKDPYQVIKSRYITEKTTVLEGLHTATGKPSLSKCKGPKYVFIVDINATKPEIAYAIEQIYSKNEVKVTAVNTIRTKRKPTRRRKGRPGSTIALKKAIVTMAPGDLIESA